MTYTIDGRDVTQRDFLAFKATLKLDSNFIDERLPPENGERGGYAAIWRATDAKGRAYEVMELSRGEKHSWSITAKPSPDRL